MDGVRAVRYAFIRACQTRLTAMDRRWLKLLQAPDQPGGVSISSSAIWALTWSSAAVKVGVSSRSAASI
jgi:hypothetical protein